MEKLLRVPVGEWDYIGYDQRHVGPMAQDFHAQFSSSGDATAFSDAELRGLALATIQGLNQKLAEQLWQKETRLESQQRQVSELFHRLGVLENKLNTAQRSNHPIT